MSSAYRRALLRRQSMIASADPDLYRHPGRLVARVHDSLLVTQLALDSAASHVSLLTTDRVAA